MLLTQQPKKISLQSIQGLTTSQTRAGMLPVIVFSYSTSVSREVRSPISVEAVTTKRLWSRYTHTKARRPPIVEGIEPLNWLLRETNASRAVRRPTFVGISPATAMSDNSISLMTANRSINTGIEPEKRVESGLKHDSLHRTQLYCTSSPFPQEHLDSDVCPVVQSRYDKAIRCHGTSSDKTIIRKTLSVLVGLCYPLYSSEFRRR